MNPITIGPGESARSGYEVVMDTQLICQKFERIGARAAIGPRIVARDRWRRPAVAGPLSIDIDRDRRGEFYRIEADRQAVDLEVVDVQRDLRHLLLLARVGESRTKEKFLCGHDERAWFVAAVPGARGVSNVRTALEALKPPAVRFAQDRARVRRKDRLRRRTKAYVRQGEWFVIPQPEFSPTGPILRHEPLSRGVGSKPHVCEMLTRGGGSRVYVCSRHPEGKDEAAYRALLARRPQARSWGWRPMMLNANVYVLGRVRHTDHKTIDLPVWHAVVMNTESEAPSMRHVQFLD